MKTRSRNVRRVPRWTQEEFELAVAVAIRDAQADERADAEALAEALFEAERALSAIERWCGTGMISGHRARALNYIGDRGDKARAALARWREKHLKEKP